MGNKDAIRIGIIGTGFARSTQIPGFQACEGARVVAIASAHADSAAAVARECGIEHASGNWREVIDRDDVDLISIVTPPSKHKEMALAALDSGKAVLCEKPMAMNGREADEMRKRAAKSGTLALIDHELRFLEGRRRARDLLKRGEIGHVVHAKLTFRADSRSDPTRGWNWWSSAEEGGGTLGAIGSHVIDGLHWFLGTGISQVFCNLSTHVKERPYGEGETRPVTTDDEALLILRFADSELTQSATGVVSLSMVEAGRPEHRLEIFGTKGALMICNGDELSRSKIGAKGWEPIEADRGEVAKGMNDNEWSRGFTAFARALIKALRERRTYIEDAATFEDGYRTQLVLDAARRSNSNGSWETPSQIDCIL